MPSAGAKMREQEQFQLNARARQMLAVAGWPASTLSLGAQSMRAVRQLSSAQE